MQPYCNALLEVDVEAEDPGHVLRQPRRMRGSLRQTDCAANVSVPDPYMGLLVA